MPLGISPWRGNSSIANIGRASAIGDCPSSLLRWSASNLRGAVEQVAEEVEVFISLTPFGEDCRLYQLPELRLLADLQEGATVTIQELQTRDDLERTEIGAAFGALRRNGLIRITDGFVQLAPNADESEVTARQQLVEQVGTIGEVDLKTLDEADQVRLRDKRLQTTLSLARNQNAQLPIDRDWHGTAK